MNTKNMTPTSWGTSPDYSRDGGINIVSDKGRYVARINDLEAPSTKADAKAIVTAVNNTYGKGINPESVEKLLLVLERAGRFLDELDWRYCRDKDGYLKKNALWDAQLKIDIENTLRNANL